MEKSFEVELKFRLDDPAAMEIRLGKMGAISRKVVCHVDRYFNHPSRDFRKTDEAFRIRSVDDQNYVTYKGAVLGTVAKTRHEIEVGLASGAETVLQFTNIVNMLGFCFVREVRKSRRSYSLSWNQTNFELTIDEVPELGFFLEIELIAYGQAREAAEAAVWRLAAALGFSAAEPRSYLDMLLAWDQRITPEGAPGSRS